VWDGGAGLELRDRPGKVASADLLLPCLEVLARFRAALVALHLRGLARLGLCQLAPELLPHGVGRVVGVRDGQAGFERGDRGVPLLALLLPRVQVLRSLLAVGLALRLCRLARLRLLQLTPQLLPHLQHSAAGVRNASR